MKQVFRPQGVFVHHSVSEHQPIALSIEDHAQPPYSEAQIANILAFQHSGIASIRCPNFHRGTDESTGDVKGRGIPNDDRLVPFEAGLACPLCGYTQETVPHIVANGMAFDALTSARDLHRKKRNA